MHSKILLLSEHSSDNTKVYITEVVCVIIHYETGLETDHVT